MHAFFFWMVRDRIWRGDPDFTVFYTAAKIIRTGRASELYDPHIQLEVQREFSSDAEIRRGPLPYIHPPFEALIFLPLTLLSYSQAFVVWNLVNLGVLFWIGQLLRSTSESLSRIPLWEFVLACLAFFPVFANFHQGQDSVLLLLMVVLGFRALERKMEFAAGCWLGLGMFKYHLMLPLFIILAIWRGRRPAAGFAVTGLAAVGLSVALVGWHGALQYPTYAWHIISLPGLGRIPFRQLVNLLGLIAGWPVLEGSRWARLAAVILSIGLLIMVVRMRGNAGGERVFRLCFSCALIAALLVGYSTNTYDLSLLVLPLVLLADECLRRSRSAAPLIIVVIPLLLSPVWFFLWLKWQRTNLMALFLLLWLFAMRKDIVSGRLNGAESIAVPPVFLV